MLYGDAKQPLEDLAQQLKQQMSRAMRQRTHLALPSLSAPAKFLPWEVFRRIAASPELTGFATSHFAGSSTRKRFTTRSSARQMARCKSSISRSIRRFVCTWAPRSQTSHGPSVHKFLTHRLNALSTNDANVLLDLMVQELVAQQPGRQQVAV